MFFQYIHCSLLFLGAKFPIAPAWSNLKMDVKKSDKMHFHFYCMKTFSLPQTLSLYCLFSTSMYLISYQRIYHVMQFFIHVKELNSLA